MTRPRIKMCGITRAQDAFDAIAAGTDAIGFIFYPPSPRNVSIEAARDIARGVPPFVTRVALFVNPTPQAVRAVLDQVPIELLQFHGDESPEFCASFGLPYLKAARVRPGFDLLKYLAAFDSAAGWLLDAYRADRFGGTGEAFDWSLIPARLDRPLVLSGGLEPGNVMEAVRQVRPWAVDVSSGIEASAGIKDAQKMQAFVAAVTAADAHE
jgi:phosphoribosylanthranilate isomerase